MAQSSRGFADKRKITENGNSVSITLNAEALRDRGFDPEELVGEEVYQKVEAGQVIIELPERE
ncbi:MAG: hypothetical protein ACOC8O_01270 [Natronomonas sp.]